VVLGTARRPSGRSDYRLADERTVSQLTQIRYRPNSRGQIVIESKNELLRRGVKSPDRADSVMLAFAKRHDPGAAFIESPFVISSANPRRTPHGVAVVLRSSRILILPLFLASIVFSAAESIGRFTLPLRKIRFPQVHRLDSLKKARHRRAHERPNFGRCCFVAGKSSTTRSRDRSIQHDA